MATQFKHSYKEFSSEVIRKRVKQMLAFRDEVNVEGAHVRLSFGNRKTGALVPSVSLIPVADCGNCSMCSRGCYDVRNVCCYRESQAQRANNSAIFKHDPVRFMKEVEMQAHFLRFLRWFVGGDIKDPAMLTAIVDIALRVPTCEFLLFTKMYSIVNNYLDDHPEGFPKNLHVILSGWRGDRNVNRHNLPVSSPVWRDGQQSCMVTKDAQWCPGDCTACAECNGGCWSAGKGQTILFEAH